MSVFCVACEEGLIERRHWVRGGECEVVLRDTEVVCVYVCVSHCDGRGRGLWGSRAGTLTE